MSSNNKIEFSLAKLLEDYLDQEKDAFFINRNLNNCIKKRTDHYYSVVGTAHNKKGNLCRVEVKFTPKETIKYKILFRKKSIVKSVREGNYYKIDKKEIKHLEKILEKVFITEEICESFANFGKSAVAVNKFNL